MGAFFKSGSTVILGPSNKKVRGPGPRVRRLWRERMLTFCRTDNEEELLLSVCLSVCMFMCRCVNIITQKFIKSPGLIAHCTRKTIVSSWSDVDYYMWIPDTGYYCLRVCMTFRFDKVLCLFSLSPHVFSMFFVLCCSSCLLLLSVHLSLMFLYGPRRLN